MPRHNKKSQSWRSEPITNWRTEGRNDVPVGGSYRNFSEEQQQNVAGNSRGRGRGHPPHLKGKEIGFYYRDLSRKKEKKLLKGKEIKIIQLRPACEQKIVSLMEATMSSHDRQFSSQGFEFNSSDFESQYIHINDSQFKRKFLNIISGNLQDNLARALCSEPKLRRNERIDRQLYDEFSRVKESNQYNNMLRFRSRLPAYERRHEILELINTNQVLVVSGETGCGKTTQVAQFILDYEIEHGRGSITSIACTQPRRISAITVAERVAAERAEVVGNSVGFHIRLERKLARSYGSITFCTTGMLLQFMQSDPALRDYSHIILDEIHERSTQSDFIITLLKSVIPKRPDLKVILMSATLNAEQFSMYYGNCPMIHIPGLTYPVEEFYLEDAIAATRFHFPIDNQIPSKKTKGHGKKAVRRRELLKKLEDYENLIKPYIKHLENTQLYPSFVFKELENHKCEELSLDLVLELTRFISTTKGPGAILIFLPGIMDISKLNRMMIECGYFPRDRYLIYPLHSRMPTVDQKLIFEVPHDGVRKIVIATNIAETSITIEDVVYVIDSGKTKMSNFDVINNLQTLELEWVSRANSRQRKGRAGRVKPGICYYLYTKAREYMFDEYPQPEMLRTRLEEVILQVKILQIGKAHAFLSSVMDPPNSEAIELSINLLRQLDALDDKENLTPLGYHLAQLPLDPRTGKMILWAAMFSCIDPIFSIAASLSFKDAFYCPIGKEEEARRKKLELGMNQFSDHIALAEALRRFENNRDSAWSFCREYFLSWNTLKLLSDMKHQFANYLYDMKFLNSSNPNDEYANRNSYNKSLIKAIVCAGLYPNVAIVKKASKKAVKAITIEKELVQLHPSSVNDRIPIFPSPYLTYFLKRKSKAIYLFDTTAVSLLALLFASPNKNIVQESNHCKITIANDLSFVCDLPTAAIIKKLHEKMDYLLEYKISHPGTIDWNNHEGNTLRAIIELLSEGDELLGMDSGHYHDWRDFDEDGIVYNDEYDD